MTSQLQCRVTMARMNTYRVLDISASTLSSRGSIRHKAQFDQCKIHLRVRVMCYNRTTILCTRFKLARSNVGIKWQIKSRASSSCLDQCFTGDYLSCSERAGKTTYTWWAKSIWWPSVLTHWHIWVGSYHEISRHDYIRDDLLSLSTQWYTEIFQACQIHIATFLWYRLPIFWESRSLIP